jgi:hypothetical protein
MIVLHGLAWCILNTLFLKDHISYVLAITIHSTKDFLVLAKKVSSSLLPIIYSYNCCFGNLYFSDRMQPITAARPTTNFCFTMVALFPWDRSLV